MTAPIYTDLKNKIVMVTGGSKGIGFGIASAFAAQGSAIRLVARDPVSLASAHQQLVKEFGVDVKSMAVNLSDDKNFDALAPFYEDADILVNSAGAMGRGSLQDIDPEKFRDAWEGKVMSTIFLTRRIYPFMKKRPHGGVIINIIGIAADRLNFKSIGTTTANAALAAFTKAMGSESTNDNIRIVGIHPGLIRTPRTEVLINPTSDADRNAYEKLMKNLPYGRMGEASEIANLAIFLASQQSAYTSGEVISVDAGSRYRY
jgi:NAD(P)-dependent dehydrogenase (short-subunit alcohol dehydrogenase family)